MTFMKRFHVTVAAAAALSALALASSAGVDQARAEFPDKNLTLIVPYGAGGGTDIGARLLAKDLDPLIKQPVIVQNITGGGGWTGWGTLATAKPDGYTLGLLNAPSFYMGYLDPKLGRKERLESFTPLINHVIDYVVVTVVPGSPYKSVKDLVEAAKAKPGSISITAHGVGGDEHLAIMQLERMTGAKFKVVHNKATPESKSQVLGNHVQVLACNLSEIVTEVKDNQLRVLGVMSPAKSRFLPTSPTFKEQGYDIEASVSRGIAGPAGLPKDVEAKLVAWLDKVVTSKEHQDKADSLFLELRSIKGDAYRKFLKDNEQTVKDLMGW
ncbi:tripartite tricarboxylate transporter substrate binding protein [Rhodoplanes sp. TEM]|uniref:Tripartite tricarboxylate transporter substrate binding protein n=1 Tax=Rhodoplanes tepidamans TaxID=200616 RepID=A0ABT5J4U7_RHOTP|nr:MULTISPECIES: tripartite tricarboxylate transporter substrate binding protein [Rhodoplanes]MDC7784431.1 tripartite tricarboxylate transporter substrate binding protein [Rhodoplanes tepidamans]MDC7983461.1 tripartite tricarboxylate transporter substrate binding protein [Rhodoplanes sp. TEM]MDQ0356938.1 tripartite-type tricarboxylate transporter receptor subunit TctC [Rhodoplanes tepidamans]